MKACHTAEQAQSIIDDFNLNSNFRSELEKWVTKTFKMGYDSIGYGDLLDFDTVDDVILDWVDERVFESERLQNEYVQNKLTDYMHSYTKEGKTFFDFRNDIDELLSNAGITDLQPHHVETIFRTEGQTALNYGRWNSQVAAIDVAPYWEYVFVDDDNHQEGTVCYDIALKGRFIRPADDPIWQRIYPPNHFNCRSGVVAITREVKERDGIRLSKTMSVNKVGDLVTEDFDGTAWEWRDFTVDIELEFEEEEIS